jgi:hypothetical protein
MNREQVLVALLDLIRQCDDTEDLKTVVGILYCLRGAILSETEALLHISCQPYVEAMLKELAKDDVIPN